MLMFGLLLALQGTPVDTTCTTAALCELVARAAEVNRVPGRLATYTARVELEAAIISVKETFVDGPTAVQQVATDVRWERNGPFTAARHRRTQPVQPRAAVAHPVPAARLDRAADVRRPLPHLRPAGRQRRLGPGSERRRSRR